MTGEASKEQSVPVTALSRNRSKMYTEGFRGFFRFSETRGQITEILKAFPQHVSVNVRVEVDTCNRKSPSSCDWSRSEEIISIYCIVEFKGGCESIMSEYMCI